MEKLSEKNNKTNYGINLLRIVSMYMIAVLHVLYHGKVLDNLSYGTVNYVIVWALEITVFCAVNCFALISGYVGVNSKYKITNIVLLWLQVVFINVITVSAFAIFSEKTVCVNDFLRAFMPISSQQYWYFSAYFILFLFIPFLNYALNNFSKRSMKWLIIVFVSSIMIFQRLSSVLFLLEINFDCLLLISLYLVGGYVKKYSPFQKTTSKKLVFLCALSLFSTGLSKVIIEFISLTADGVVNYGGIFISYFSPTIFLTALILLELFSRIKFEKKPILVSFLSPLAFGVYIIHEQPIIRETFIAGKFSYLAYYTPALCILCVLGFALLIYILCSVLDYLRLTLFNLLKIKPKLLKQEERLKEKIKR